MPKASSGYFGSGLPYNRIGHGPRVVVVFQGLMFENKPLPIPIVPSYRFLARDFTVYIVNRRPGLPAGYSLQDMADDYAAMIRDEFEGPVDVIGLSIGGSIALYFAAGYPDLVRRLVIHSSAHSLSAAGRAVRLRVAYLVRQGYWRAAYATMMAATLPRSGAMGFLAGRLVRLPSLMAVRLLGTPEDPFDLLVTIEAEGKHSFLGRLGEITAPTLVVAGDQDPFYTDEQVRETAVGIPYAQFILYAGVGHPATGQRFERDVLAFLRGE